MKNDRNKNLTSYNKNFCYELCRRTDLIFDDIFIYHHEVVNEDVVLINGKFSGYLDGFWQQGHWRKYLNEKETK